MSRLDFNLRSIRWWAFLPLLHPVICYGWLQLGIYMGYEFGFQPNNVPVPRYDWLILEWCYYPVFWALLLSILPGMFAASYLEPILPETLRFAFALCIGGVLLGAMLVGVCIFAQPSDDTKKQKGSDESFRKKDKSG